MATVKDALECVSLYLGKLPADGFSYAINSKLTKEYDEGWLVYYNSKEFIETGDFLYALAGNGPLFVRKSDLKLFIFGVHDSIDCILKTVSLG